MEFKSLKNIETSFKQIRFFGIVFVVLCTGIVGYSLFSAYNFAEQQRQKIYVLDGGKSLMLALSQDLSQNRPVEAKEHVKRFHELFFTLSPDKSAIESNIRRALFLVDRSAFGYYKDLQEKGYYNRVISGNINQKQRPADVRFDGALVRRKREKQFVKTLDVFPCFDRTVLRQVLRKGKHQ
jgi:conjugative transposon TraK protein